MPVHANIEPLTWESAFFRQPSGKLVFDPAAAPLSLPELDAYGLVQARIPADRPELADDLALLGFRLAEGEIDLSCAPPIRPAAEDPAIRLADEDDIPCVRRLASSALTQSRFREPWYRRQDRERFYALWAENAIRGSFDHLCLVMGAPGDIRGLITLRALGADEARIGLLAVDPAHGGRGIGRALFMQGLAWCGQRQIKCLRVATQAGNIPALRLYLRCGATIDRTAYWLYR